MAHYRATITCDAPPDVAFPYIADFANVAAWDPGVASAEQRTHGPVGLGAEFTVDVRSVGRTLPFAYRIITHTPPQRVAFLGEYGGMVSEDVVDIEPTARGGSRVTYDADLRLKGPLRVFDPVLALAFRRIGDRAISGLQDALAGLEALR